VFALTTIKIIGDVSMGRTKDDFQLKEENLKLKNENYNLKLQINKFILIFKKINDCSKKTLSMQNHVKNTSKKSFKN
jgi:hypothetical protein